MPVHCSIDGRVVRVELIGRYEPGDIVAACDGIMADPAFPNDAVMLLDVRQSGELTQRPAGDVRRVAKAFVVRASRFGGRCALLAGTTAQFGMARMASVFAETPGVEAEAFTSEAEALQWLLSDTTP